MSGGSQDYLYLKLQEVETGIEGNDDRRRIAFKRLLKLTADALHDVEWVDSGDRGKGAEHEAIDKVFAFLQADPETIYKAHAFDTIIEIARTITTTTDGGGYTWVCGCSHRNGCSLATCAACGRKPNGEMP